MSLSPLQVYRAGERRWAYWRAELGRWVVATEISLDEAAEEIVLDDVIALMQRDAGAGLELALRVASDDGHGRRSAGTFTPRVDLRTREARAARSRRAALVR